MSGFKEHVVYLIDTIHVMKDRLSKLSEMYKTYSKVECDEVVKSIDSIHKVANSKLINVRRRKTELEKNLGMFFMSHLKNSLLSFVKNK